jgi:uncharacterized protein (UPF0332 family)
MTNRFDPTIFLEIAKVLCNDRQYDDAGRWRTSIGRAYYAAFLIAYSYLKNQGIRIENISEIHKEVIEKIGEEGFTKIKNKLEKLRTFRIDADYNLEESVGESQCNTSISLSEIIINDLKLLL